MSLDAQAKPNAQEIPGTAAMTELAPPDGFSQRPVIIFHGNDNAISLARVFGRRKIPVFALNETNATVFSSRYVRPLAVEKSKQKSFKQGALDYLLDPASQPLHGAVLLAASDDALEALIEHRDELQSRFVLDISNVEAQRTMLNKLETYRVAACAEVPTPAFWQIQSPADLANLRSELKFPLLVKPILSHNFQKQFPSGVKFLVAQNYQEAHEAVSKTNALDIPVLLLELIPGPDTALCSYYTYLDEQGTPLFHFTKRIIRRFPEGMGLATYHIVDNVPDVQQLALKLFQAAGLQGVANAEFKLDPRDQQLKLIECNARFTAANVLVAQAGIDIGSLVYNRLVGLPLPNVDRYRTNLTLWDPMRDFRAYRERSRKGTLNLGGWLRSIARLHTFPCFRWSDPLPAITRLRSRLS